MALTSAGMRRALIAVENPTRVVDSDGGYTDTYGPASPPTLYMRLEPMDSAERQHAGIVDTTITHRVIGPYHAGITTQTRLRYGTRTLVVKAVRDPEERQIDLELLAAEVPATPAPVVPVVTQQYQKRVLADGASHYWRLNETSGTVAWDLAGGMGGAITGGVTLGQPGALGDGSTAMVVNGTGKILTAPRAINAPFSLEIWFKTSSTVPNQVIFCNTWGPPDCFAVFLQNGYLSLYPGGATTYTLYLDATYKGISPPVASDGQWHHAVFLVATGPASSGSRPLQISYGDAWPNEGWIGSLDEIAIYPRALTAQEVADHYALRTAP